MKYLSVKGRKEVLEQILKEKRVYERFIDILSKKSKFYDVNDIDSMIEHHIADASYTGAINALCIWSSTKEGSNFWVGVNKKYVDTLERGGKLTGCKSIW